MKPANPFKFLILFGPSGSGKGTLLKYLFDQFPNKFLFSVSHTTRKPRNNEVDGRNYYFTTNQVFQNMIENGKFFEYVEYADNLYGTSYQELSRIECENKIGLLELDIKGVELVKNSPICTKTKYIFVQSPDFNDLETRLRERSTEEEESLKKRLTTAKFEISKAKEIGYDSIIINEDIEESSCEIRKIVLDWFPELEN